MNLIRSFDAMTSRVVYKALGALDDTGEDEGYGREGGKEWASILEDDLVTEGVLGVLYRESSF